MSEERDLDLNVGRMVEWHGNAEEQPFRMEWLATDENGWWLRILADWPYADWVGDIRWFSKKNGYLTPLDYVWRSLVESKHGDDL